MAVGLKEINWNGGYYRVGGTLIYNGEIKTISFIEVDVKQNGPSLFDRKRMIRITTDDGKVIESIERG